MFENGMRPIHPGEILHEHLGMGENAPTKALSICRPHRRADELNTGE